MESAVSQSAPADSIAAARQGMDALVRRGGGGVLLMDKSRTYYTICACCGSMVLDHNGKVQHAALMTAIGPDEDSVIEYHRQKYGEDFKLRFGSTWEASLKQMTLANKPGVVFSFMDKESAIKVMYPDPETAELADGYEFGDVENGPMCVLWLNK